MKAFMSKRLKCLIDNHSQEQLSEILSELLDSREEGEFITHKTKKKVKTLRQVKVGGMILGIADA